MKADSLKAYLTVIAPSVIIAAFSLFVSTTAMLEMSNETRRMYDQLQRTNETLTEKLQWQDARIEVLKNGIGEVLWDQEMADRIESIVFNESANLGHSLGQITSTYIAHYVIEYARVNGLKPELVLAVIHTESAYNPTIVSHAGAIGLMQLMPLTAKEIERKYNIKYRRLRNVQHNIKLGTHYLGDMLKMFDGDTRNALAAYNAGPNHVIKRLAAENGFYEETEKYVEKVMRLTDYYRNEILPTKIRR